MPLALEAVGNVVICPLWESVEFGPAVPAVPPRTVFDVIRLAVLDSPELSKLVSANPRPCAAVKVGNAVFDDAECEESEGPGGIEFENVEFWRAKFDVVAVTRLVGTKLETAISPPVATSLVLFGRAPVTKDEERVGEEPSLLEESKVDEDTLVDDEATEIENVELEAAEFDTEEANVGARLRLAVSVALPLDCPTTSFILSGDPANVEEISSNDDELIVSEGMSVDEQAAAEEEGPLEDNGFVQEAVCNEQAEREDCTEGIADRLEVEVDQDDIDEDVEDRETIQLH